MGSAAGGAQGLAPRRGYGSDEEEEEGDRVDLAESSLLNKLIRTSLVESSHHVEILQQDPTSPLFSVKTFEELPLKNELLRGIYNMGFNRPSKIQETALPMMLAHPPQNLIAQSQSGTGKTAAFVLAMLSRVNAAERYPQCLCLAPTFELALQIGRVIEKMGQFCVSIKVTYAIQGNRVPHGTMLEEQIVIGTPGTVLDWCFKRRVLNLKKISVFVLDEADIMIDTQGFSSQSIRIQRVLPKDCQMLLFSATFKKTVWKFATQIISNPIVIKLRQEELTLSTIRQYYFVCENRVEKYRALCNIYGSITIGQAIIFCQTRKIAEWLSLEMTEDGHQVAMLTAELTVEQRANVIQRFRDGKEKVLITTNVCARGIDVKQVTIVVNFNLPANLKKQPDFETYLHRIGRTGRFGKKGIAFNMVESRNLYLLRMIEEHFQTEIKRLDPDDMDELEKIDE
ncbi:ATP-dependent RNA helicase DDX25 isoform X2 [Struthio camelus]|uniref:ATP-dependent RNA helicase DDX25 isoform X2 n=1 Tax=Struthio camelus TaxID=8801 RepID=UPI0036041AD5